MPENQIGTLIFSDYNSTYVLSFTNLRYISCAIVILKY